MLFDSKEEEVQRAKIILLIAIWLKRFKRSAWQVFLTTSLSGPTDQQSAAAIPYQL